MNIILILKKIAIIFLASIIFFTGTIAMPTQKAHAIAIPVALQGAAGAYVLGGVLVAAGLGAVGYDEHGEEIKAHTQRAWDNSVDLSKAGINMMIEGAIGTGNVLQDVDTTFNAWMESQLGGIASFLANRHQTVETDNRQVTQPYINSAPSLQVQDYWYGSYGAGAAVYVNGKQASSVSVGFGPYHSRTQISYKDGTSGGTDYSGASSKFKADARKLIESTPNDAKSILAVMASFGLAITFGADSVPLYNDYKTKADEVWRGMRDAGLVLPVDSFVPVSSAGEPLTYNPSTGALTGIDGGVYTGDHTWRIPNINWRDKTAAVPEAGAWVETPVTIPGVTVNNPAVPKTITNIRTGTTVANPETVANPDIPIEGETPGGGTPTTPPENGWNRPPTKKPPNIGGLITTKFPFSLPFDFFGVLGWLNAEPKAPVFKIDTGIKSPLSEKEVKLDMEFKFNFLDPYMGFFRSFIIIGFSLFLILATRKLLGGAG